MRVPDRECWVCGHGGIPASNATDLVCITCEVSWAPYPPLVKVEAMPFELWKLVYPVPDNAV